MLVKGGPGRRGLHIWTTASYLDDGGYELGRLLHISGVGNIFGRLLHLWKTRVTHWTTDLYLDNEQRGSRRWAIASYLTANGYIYG